MKKVKKSLIRSPAQGTSRRVAAELKPQFKSRFVEHLRQTSVQKLSYQLEKFGKSL
jgi:hypothetical protein